MDLGLCIDCQPGIYCDTRKYIYVLLFYFWVRYHDCHVSVLEWLKPIDMIVRYMFLIRGAIRYCMLVCQLMLSLSVERTVAGSY